MLTIEYCQFKIVATDRRMERQSFVEPEQGFIRRYARFIRQLSQHVGIAAVATYPSLVSPTVKSIDERALTRDLPALDHGALAALRFLGVDEVARAKGHGYLTIVYDLDSDDLSWVTEGRCAAGLTACFDQLDEPVAPR